MEKETKELIQQLSTFSKNNIANRPYLCTSTFFPYDLWRIMADQGLFASAIPYEFGGKGIGYKGIYQAGKALSRYGQCLGITLSWLMHQLTGRFFISCCASEDQKKRYLCAMATGAITPCIALSEPGAGAHPKHLSTAAIKMDRGYAISGEKTFITNGPIADFFIVFAITKINGIRKNYSAFMVEKNTPGLSLGEPLDLGFLRPCPHGSIKLDNCFVSEDDLIGIPGVAYDELALPFRKIEMAIMIGPMLGAELARSDMVTDAVEKSVNNNSAEINTQLGRIRCVLDETDNMALEVIDRLEYRLGQDTQDSLTAIRHKIKRVHNMLDQVASSSTINLPASFYTLTRDLEFISKAFGRSR